MARKATDRKSQAGQSLVEFTLIGIFLMIVLVGLLDLGRAFFARIAIIDAAAEGAAYAAIRPDCALSTTGVCADPNNVRYRVRHASESLLIRPEDISVQVYSPDLSSGNEVTVTARYSFTLMTPFIQTLLGQDILVIQASAVERIQ